MAKGHRAQTRATAKTSKWMRIMSRCNSTAKFGSVFFCFIFCFEHLWAHSIFADSRPAMDSKRGGTGRLVGVSPCATGWDLKLEWGQPRDVLLMGPLGRVCRYLGKGLCVRWEPNLLDLRRAPPHMANLRLWGAPNSTSPLPLRRNCGARNSLRESFTPPSHRSSRLLVLASTRRS